MDLSNEPVNPILTWNRSDYADMYEYCYDTTNDDKCANGWKSTTATQVQLAGLGKNTTYYWQVRAKNSAGMTDADKSQWWSFTVPDDPGPFGKVGPSSGTVFPLTSPPTLSWGTSSYAAEYKYCVISGIDPNSDSNSIPDNCWISVGSRTSVALSSNLTPAVYYWQVRAENAVSSRVADAGEDNNWWSFVITPGDFGKSRPGNGNFNQPINTVLSWSPSAGADYYEYCLTTSPAADCDTEWVSLNNISASLFNLDMGSKYYWQVRARSHLIEDATYADKGEWWSFKVPFPPGPFALGYPANNARNVPATEIEGYKGYVLRWQPSNDAVDYFYCIDTIDNGACDTTWMMKKVVASDLVSLRPCDNSLTCAFLNLQPATKYYWLVEARNANGMQYANDGIWWSFTTMSPAPGNFEKAGASVQLNVPPYPATQARVTLSWAKSDYAASYEVCVDPINNNVCDSNWQPIDGLSYQIVLYHSCSYYWQVRARNDAGVTYADCVNCWSSFVIKVK